MKHRTYIYLACMPLVTLAIAALTYGATATPADAQAIEAPGQVVASTPATIYRHDTLAPSTTAALYATAGALALVGTMLLVTKPQPYPAFLPERRRRHAAIAAEN